MSILRRLRPRFACFNHESMDARNLCWHSAKKVTIVCSLCALISSFELIVFCMHVKVSVFAWNPCMAKKGSVLMLELLAVLSASSAPMINWVRSLKSLVLPLSMSFSVRHGRSTIAFASRWYGEVTRSFISYFLWIVHFRLFSQWLIASHLGHQRSLKVKIEGFLKRTEMCPQTYKILKCVREARRNYRPRIIAPKS